MPAKKLKKFLNSSKVKYKAIKHSPAYTAQEIAASAHVPGRELAKTVIINVDGTMAMAVMPAPEQIDFKLLKKALGAKRVKLASEKEFADSFPECEPGAMPPFGNLYDMDVYVAESLTEDEQITFNAGSHSELIRLDYKDFEKLVEPKVVNFTG